MDPARATLEPRVRLDASTRICVVSDLHLGDGGPVDAFGRNDDRLRRFLGELASRCDALVIAGDGFDIAQAGSIERICEAHRRIVDDLCSLSRTMPVYYLRGNHEGSARPLMRELPLRYANELFVGDRIRVEHGNAFDPYNQPGDRTAFLAARMPALIERGGARRRHRQAHDRGAGPRERGGVLRDDHPRRRLHPGATGLRRAGRISFSSATPAIP